MSRQVLFAGNPANLAGNEIKVGDKAPDFTTLDKDLQPVKLSDYAGKNVIVTVFPSVDTSVCSMQAHKFNQIASTLEDDTHIITISVDLPFALGRYCAADGIDNITVTSDHKDLDFANKYGYLMEDMRLLARGTVVIGKDGIVKYVEFVPEVTTEPNYDAALDALK